MRTVRHDAQTGSMKRKDLSINKRLRLGLGAAALSLGAAAVVVAAHSNPDQVTSRTTGATSATNATSSGSAPPEKPTVLPTISHAPELDTSSGWLNGRSAEVHNHVVLYELWTFDCSNCRATLPYVRALWHRYEREGLVIIGIHTPEFSYEAEPANIQRAANELGVTWPVLLDPERVNWRAFANRFWPRVFIADTEGSVRFDHIGEGAYSAMEDAIRTLLQIDPTAPRATFPHS